MKDTDTTLSFYSSVFIQLIFVILLLIIWSYIYKLENIGCACSEHSNKEFIKTFTMVALVYFFITAFIPMKTIAKSMGIGVVQLLAFGTFIFFLAFVVYIYYAFDYVRYLMNEKCKCSEDLRRDIIAIGTMISLFLFMVLLFTIIIIPILISTLTNLIVKIQDFESEVEEVIKNPVKSLSNTPGRLFKSTRDIGSFVKSTATKLTKVKKGKK
jgi:predicted PurR-regulated permease PerM|uniref:MARVEL domain-containing protein n=1 Tax=viral metagenome TaxID=1070528 RepID=A0A6C0IAM6_9ZZZZ